MRYLGEQERRHFELGEFGAVARFQMVRVAPGELPFLALEDDGTRLVERQVTLMRDAARIYSAIRDYAGSAGPAQGRAMVETLARMDHVFATVTGPALAFQGEGAAAAQRREGGR